MGRADSNDLGPGGTAGFVALAGTIAFLLGVGVSALLGPIGLFFMVLGGVTVLASPLIWALMLWDARSGR